MVGSVELRRYFAAFLFAACRAFKAATILARPSGLSPPFFFTGLATGVVDVPLDLAQRALCAAAILARASGDIVRLPGFATGDEVALGAETTGAPPPTKLASWA